uniref:Tyrosine-protein phosphatase domain-containing protein n=1 Tax=Elaeophora elaphi TaxID=1147741 RepID=A0A0R3RQ07_9BILA
MASRATRQRRSAVQKQNATDAGEKPADFVALIAKQSLPKTRRMHFDRLVTTTAINGSNTATFLAQVKKNRVPVPLFEKKRVKLSSMTAEESDYLPATYASFNREDYIIIQAPTKETTVDFWRMVWQDGCKLIVCVMEQSQMTTEDDAASAGAGKCYQYWPTKPDSKMEIGQKRFAVKLVKKKEEKGFIMYDLAFSAYLDVDINAGKIGPKTDGLPDTAAVDDDSKPRSVTLFHVTNWSNDIWPDLDQLGPFIKTLASKEVQIIKRAADDYIPPVVLQGFAGLNRTCVVWVATILMKQIERRECFDVEYLARHLMRIRPGAFSDPISFFVLFALAFRIASLGGWSAYEDAKERIKEIKAIALLTVKAREKQ